MHMQAIYGTVYGEQRAATDAKNVAKERCAFQIVSVYLPSALLTAQYSLSTYHSLLPKQVCLPDPERLPASVRICCGCHLH